MKKQGFTLIELLVVITIMAILATVAFPNFRKFFITAQDGTRLTNVTQMASVIKTDNAMRWKNDKYYPTDTAKSDREKWITEMLTANDYAVPKTDDNTCYVMVFGQGAENATPPDANGVGSDNEFLVATWGERTSTGQDGKPGIMASGTLKAKLSAEALTNLTGEKFKCANAVTALKTVLTGLKELDDTGAFTSNHVFGDGAATNTPRFYLIHAGKIEEK